MKKLNLFCLPFAGGNKYSYRAYVDQASSSLNIISLDYPGRGSRVTEPLLEDLNDLVNDVYSQINNRVAQADYAIYGHSMGGLLAYLVTRKLIANNLKAPLHLFITGTTGPSALSRTVKKRHLLSGKEFIDEMRSLGGIPDEILKNEEWLSYFEPILRADLKATESYMHEDCAPLRIPITVITGSEEDMEITDIHYWQKETAFKVDFRQMPGDHFFIYKYPQEIVEIISKKLVVNTNLINYG